MDGLFGMVVFFAVAGFCAGVVAMAGVWMLLGACT